jgi:hypothetical protein
MQLEHKRLIFNSGKSNMFAPSVTRAPFSKLQQNQLKQVNHESPYNISCFPLVVLARDITRAK